MLNKDLFTTDPTTTKIPNDGVATVGQPETEQQWDVLRWELESFVCDGEYERGLERILDSFLKNLGQSRQPAVWVSGFYGSGKSHLCRVLEYLWRDVKLLSGQSARDLVSLPPEIEAHFAELSTAGKRLGGLWSAAGTLGAGKSQAVRLAFMSVIFEAAGLPEQYPLARFVLWAEDHGYADAVAEAVKDAGKALDRELSNLYVSPIIAQALLNADPTLGDSVKDVRDLLKTQFPPQTADITDEEMFDALKEVLHRQSDTDGRYPLTLVVLDEMQQYLGDDNVKTLAVQNIVEGVTAEFDNSVLFVTTGQSAMGGTPTLQKLTDRFPVQIQLSDKDVETVVRQVILRKKPDKVAELEVTLDAASGEIARHLGGTKIGATAADQVDLVPDYPLLPTRRRFWELALKALDRAGKAGVLRTQLRITHEATREVAGNPVGHVVGADFIYDQQAPALQQSGVLLKEIDELIRGLQEHGPDGLLKSRICALVFLINNIPKQMMGTGEIGLRPNEATIADLLIEDLAAGGAELRKRVPELLEKLVNAGSLMRIDDEYRLQTEEGADWEKEYRSRLSSIKDDPSKLATLRNHRLLESVDGALKGLKLTHGTSNTPRKIDPVWGEEQPADDGERVPVWIRDGWSVTDSAVRSAAAHAGHDSPVVFVLLPKQDAEAIRDALASHEAAQQTIDAKPTPQTDEGKEAQRAMKGRLAQEDDRLRGLFATVAERAHVLQGGGNELDGLTLRAKVETAADNALARLFPKFDTGDSPHWGKVTTKARDGAPDALDAVGYQGEVAKHPVCKEVLATIAASGTKGTELLARFEGPPFGWPRDAVQGSVMALFAARNIIAKRDGVELSSTSELAPREIGKTTFYKQDDPPSQRERLAVRGLIAAAGIEVEANKEEAQLPALLQRLIDLAQDAGGAAPLPAPPDTTHVKDLQSKSGNDRFRAVAKAQADLKQQLQDWGSAAQQREARQAGWNELERLLNHAKALPMAEEVAGQRDAIREQRQLLNSPDPVKPLIGQLHDALRTELQARATSLVDAQKSALDELEIDGNWQKLDSDTRKKLIRDAGFVEVALPSVDTGGKLLSALDDTPLSQWDERIAYLSAKIANVREAAAKHLEPEATRVSPPPATIHPGQPRELDDFLAQFRKKIEAQLDQGATVII